MEQSQAISVSDLIELTDKDDYEVYDHVTNKWIPIAGCRYLEPGRGYSPPDEAFNPITAVSVYLNWLDRCFTLVLKPRKWTMAEAHAVCEQFPDTLLCETENELLDLFLGLIEDCDVISGWNSSTYDIPYVYNRIIQLLGKEQTRRMCLWNKLPVKREFLNYGKKQVTYELQGRVHLDYLDLYRKHTYQELHSYKLDFVGELDTGERKVPYEGSLDTLYNKDFKKFIEYNRQDVMLLVKIDAKRKLIELCNNLAHQNCVLLATTRGSVALIDQAIVNDAWDQGLVVPNRRAEEEPEDSGDFDMGDEDEDDDGTDEKHGIVGAYVADPKKGMHEHIGGVDITSLYPSDIRALNMSPETIVGHIRPEYTDKLIRKRMHQEKRKFSDAWSGLFSTLEFAEVHNQSDMPLVVDFEKGGTVTVTAAEMYKLVFLSKKPWILSANGTIFTTEKLGVIPGLLARWFADRMKMQAEMKKYGKLADEATDPDQKAELEKQRSYYDQRQLIQKILLNSLYGAIGNAGSRFFDERIAQSVTLTGRCIARHMGAKLNEIITGDYNHLGDAIIYQDTDSLIGESIIKSNWGEISIEGLFNRCTEFSKIGEKEYAYNTELKVVSYDQDLDEPYYGHISYIYRHKVSKGRWEVEDEDGNTVVITEDHSVMIERDGQLLEISPKDMLETDILLTLVDK